MADENSDLEKEVKKSNLKRYIFTAVAPVVVAGACFAGRYLNTNHGEKFRDALVIGGTAAFIGAVYKMGKSERDETIARTGVDPWGESYSLKDRTKSYKNFFTKDLDLSEDEDSE